MSGARLALVEHVHVEPETRDLDPVEVYRATIAADAARPGAGAHPFALLPLTPPEAVRLIAAAALSGPRASLADRALAERIAADALTRDDLAVMASGEAAEHGGGELGAMWAADELRLCDEASPWGWLTRATREPEPDTPETRAAYWHEWIRALHGPGERRVLLATASALAQWQAAIVARVPDVLGPLLDGRAVTRIDIPAWLGQLIGIEEARAILRSEVGEQILKVMEIAFRRAARELAVSGLVWAPTVSPVTLAIGQMITRVTETTVQAVAAAVADAIAAGESTTALQARLMQMPEFGRARARTIARTETGRVASIGTDQALDQAQALGVQVEDQWITARDGSPPVRPSHNALDGVTIPHGAYFTTPDGATTKGPCQFGVAAEDINCRCAKRPIANRSTP